ncbi:MAG: GatB/YqeY domain-containing protein [Bacteroidetes bacterium]|nr:MAG: GatB/YqeY domain-containing protein [Bacteroidota bacterium]MBL1145727.1 GatB/YqeY domain-containing protein [Bacteroidota bacterium]MCB0803220.1 GatB/YqeY domain-containing protein [Flavobacteriales bacterium]NOG58521.1 GatB/YqeY domain-containing protein [Bacteroidota bacterium]
MNLTDQINNDIKTAMKAKDKVSLEALRAIKAALLMAATEKGAGDTSEAAEMKMLQKLVKQRKDAASIFSEQGREDLAEPELAQISIIEKYLPAQLSEEDVKAIVAEVVKATGASSMADMGKVMGMVNQKTAGQADGKMVADLVKKALV